MKDTTTIESNNAPSRSKAGLLRATALTAALAAGTTLAFLGAAPTVFAAASGSDASGSFLQRMHGGAHSHAAMREHVDQVLAEVGASDAQKQQIHAVVGKAMSAQHTDMKIYHESALKLKTLLTAAQIDERAVEAVRAEQDQLAVATSRRLSDTAVAVARILTPAQRERLGERIDQLMASGMGHHQLP